MDDTLVASQPLRAAQRVLNVLEQVNAAGVTTISALARAVNLPRSTVVRIVATLRSLGYLETDGVISQVRPTRRVLNLAKGFDASLDVLPQIQEVLSTFTRITKWPLVFTRQCGVDIEIAATTDFESPLAIDRHQAGFRLRIDDSASGCVMLAASTADIREPLYEALEREHDSDEKNGLSDLQGRIRRAQDHGHAWHRRSGKCEAVIAVPLTDEHGDAIGALGMRYVHSAMTESEVARRFLAQIREAAGVVTETWRTNGPVRYGA